jgi:hypothetical protein
MSVEISPGRRSVTLTIGTVALIAGSILAAFIAVTIAVVIVAHAYDDQRTEKTQLADQAGCRSNLAVAVDVTKGPILLAEGDLLIHLVDAVVNRTDSKAQLTADVQAFNAVRPAYEQALKERSQTEATCG